MDTKYTFNRWPGEVKNYMDLEWLQPQKPLIPQDLALPESFVLNPDETDENSISGPQKSKVLELFDDLNTPALTQEMVDAFRSLNRKAILES